MKNNARMEHNGHHRQHFSYAEILHLIEPGSTVLDLGCGEGELLERLIRERGVRGRGVDIEERMIRTCISRGLSVFQGDLDEGLKDYTTNSYDYVILNHTLQVVHRPDLLLQEMLRVGRFGIVNFPNFAHILNRLQLFAGGRMPVNRHIPYEWYDTPNIHFCTRRDFEVLCREMGYEIIRIIDTRNGKRRAPFLCNLLSTEVCFLLRGTD